MRSWVLAAAVLCASVADADIVTWNFGTTTSATSPPGSESAPITNFTIGTFTIGNTLGTIASPINSTSASTTYAGASGNANIGNAFRIGALATGASGSGFLSLIVTNSTGGTVTLDDFDFGVRSTSTGAANYSLRSSVDSFATDITTGTITVTGNPWQFKNNTFASFNLPAGATELRLYGYGGTGSPGNGTENTRFDDVMVTFSAAAVPEASPALFGAMICGVMGLAYGGRSLWRKKPAA